MNLNYQTYHRFRAFVFRTFSQLLSSCLTVTCVPFALYVQVKAEDHCTLSINSSEYSNAQVSMATSRGAFYLKLQDDDVEIRRELEAQYKKLAEAHDRKDLKAIVALKTSDFHAVFPDGRIGDSKLMEQYSIEFLKRNQPPFDFRFTIQKLTVSYNKFIAIAEVFQEGTRFQDLAGQRRKVETSVVQRETWTKTAEGWKLKSVDNVHDQKKFVDGRRVDPTKPYNPDEPPYIPQ